MVSSLSSSREQPSFDLDEKNPTYLEADERGAIKEESFLDEPTSEHALKKAKMEDRHI